MSEILVVYCQIQGGFHTVKINAKKEESHTGENKKHAPTDLLVDKRNAHNEKKCPLQKKLPQNTTKTLREKEQCPKNINAYIFHIVTSNYKQLKTNTTV
jgi:hypothetical protein